MAAAAEGHLKELREEASCSVCLDFFRDPVTIAGCGHNFCRACLTQSWGDLQGAEASCPQCRGRAQEGTLRPNHQLANLVEIIQKLRPVEGKGAEGKGGICEKRQEPLIFFCKVCGISKEHEDHEEIPLEEAFQENRATVAGRKERFCQKHQEPLKLFCKDDEALICVVCDRSKEHRDHETLPLDEASEEYKDEFCDCLEKLKEEREQIVASKAEVEEESQELLKQTTEEKQETVAMFRDLHTFLEEQEKLLLAQLEEVEKEVAKNRDQHLAELSEALSSLDSLIQEMEEKCQQPATELLQDARSTLLKYEEKEAFENPAAFPLSLKWRIWDCSDLTLFLEGTKKQFKDSLDSGLHLQKADVTLDPDTAHPELILSEDRKSVRDGEKPQTLPNNPERFDYYSAVLGREGFTGGRHFWEVLVGKKEQWAVGVARKSVRRKGDITFSPEEGIWEMGKWEGHYRASMEDDYPPLTLSGEPKRIRVCLNYDGGRVAFFDADRRALIFEFSGASFSGETLLPYFWVCGKATLKLSS
ncbi:E3 ubiquitin-protein ligase TRIM39-like [Sphaerodactylus townsendi]|uniref:E3 ubiquitin-protein ligase TRIM39-like n=1 Tax=Sphaerodactylus townsendi TaxID=933632 RepID=UPI002025CB84|nr:E3 ubiquitin-protein ligase TRIM39-like [Sphaerodactylus townsendi]